MSVRNDDGPRTMAASEATFGSLRRLHVVGCPRSGTTLVAELVATCFADVGHDEHELSIFRPAPQTFPVYVSKKPMDVKRIGPLLRADRQLFVIGVHRDPRAVITSEIADEGFYRISYDRWERCLRAERALAGHPRYLEVEYERLVRDPDAVQADIEARFPFLVRRHAFSEFAHHAQPTTAAEIAMGGVRSLDANRNARWRQHLPRVKAELIRHPRMIDVLIELGYERDASWTRVLDGILPHDQPVKGRWRRVLEELDATVRYGIKQRRYLRELARTPQPEVPAWVDTTTAQRSPLRTSNYGS